MLFHDGTGHMCNFMPKCHRACRYPKAIKKIVNRCFHLNKMIRNEGHNTSINVTKLFLRISKNDQKLWLLL